MAETVVVVGTDTGVGKTWVGCALARALRASGRTVVAVKPVETGCAEVPDGGEDGVRLARATGQAEPACALARLAEPLAPAVALERAGARLELDDLTRRIRRYAQGAEVVLVEGAGGLLSPLTWEWSAVDLARALAAPALVVAADRLGTINHTLLTLSALERAGVALAGVVLTAPAAPDLSTGLNAAAIARLSGIDRILVAPRTDDPAAAARALAGVLPWLVPA